MGLVGDRLREARLKRRLSISECSKRTHVSARYLDAMEAEHWIELPSESHRIGFLRLYGQFLGIPIDDLLQTYNQSKIKEFQPSVPQKDPVHTPPPHLDHSLTHKPELIPTESHSKAKPKLGTPLASKHVLLLATILFVMVWGGYHLFNNEGSVRTMDHLSRSFSKQIRLDTPKPIQAEYRIRILAKANTWLRVTDHEKLLFEGILTMGTEKSWVSTVPLKARFANPQAVSVFCNETPLVLPNQAPSSGVIDIDIPASSRPPQD